MLLFVKFALIRTQLAKYIERMCLFVITQLTVTATAAPERFRFVLSLPTKTHKSMLYGICCI